MSEFDKEKEKPRRNSAVAGFAPRYSTAFSDPERGYHQHSPRRSRTRTPAHSPRRSRTRTPARSPRRSRTRTPAHSPRRSRMGHQRAARPDSPDALPVCGAARPPRGKHRKHGGFRRRRAGAGHSAPRFSRGKRRAHPRQNPAGGAAPFQPYPLRRPDAEPLHRAGTQPAAGAEAPDADRAAGAAHRDVRPAAGSVIGFASFGVYTALTTSRPSAFPTSVSRRPPTPARKTPSPRSARPRCRISRSCRIPRASR